MRRFIQAVRYSSSGHAVTIRWLVALTGSVLAAGCVSTSGVLPKGEGVFTVTSSASHGAGGVPRAKADAYALAVKQCGSANALKVDSEKLSPPAWTEGMAIATLEFRCAAP